MILILLAAATVLQLEEASVAGLQQKLQSGQVTARLLTAAYLKAIQTIDPKLRSVIAVNPRALEEAAALDAAKTRGPLYGIPVLVKDNLAAAGMPTTAGSLALKGIVSPRDSFVVKRLREAGA